MRLILELAKYLMLVILVLYSILNCVALTQMERPMALNRTCRKQLCITVMMIACGYLILYETKEDQMYAIFALIQAGIAIVYYLLFGFLYRNGSRMLISNAVMLSSIGLLVQARLDMEYAWKQLIYLAVGMALTLVIPALIRYFHFLTKWSWVYAVLGIVLLFIVKMVGKTTLGAQLSISIGPITIQPSEFVKITFVFMTAALLSKRNDFGRVLLTTVLAAIHVIILVASTDLGSALVYFISYLFMLYVSTHQITYLLSGIITGSGAAVLAHKLFAHVRIRVQVWQNPFQDYDNKGYQICQALFGISTGGWLGLGLGQGLSRTIPLARNDMVFAVICEELGAIFAILTLVIFLLFIMQLCMVSLRLDEQFYKILGVGFAVMIGFQTFLHVGGVCKMIPMTGITMPLISYGGSSILSTMIITGTIQGLHLKRAKEERDLEREQEERERA